MSFSSFNYRIASSLSARSAVDSEQWQTCLKQILECKDLQPIIIDRLTNPVNKYIANNIFSSLILLQQHRLMAQKIERQLDKDLNLFIKRKSNALLYHILFPNPKQMQQKQNPVSKILLHEQTPNPYCKAYNHYKMCAHCSIQPKEKNSSWPQQWSRSPCQMSLPYHFSILSLKRKFFFFFFFKFV